MHDTRGIGFCVRCKDLMVQAKERMSASLQMRSMEAERQEQARRAAQEQARKLAAQQQAQREAQEAAFKAANRNEASPIGPYQPMRIHLARS